MITFRHGDGRIEGFRSAEWGQMMAKQRASAGNTHDVWPCCGAEADRYGRPKGGICGACQALIAEGKAARAMVQKLDRVPFRWTERDYGFPSYYGGGFPSREVNDLLKRALFELVKAAAVPAPADTPRDSPRFTMEPSPWGERKPERRHLPWNRVLSVDGPSHDSWSWGVLVLLPVELQQAIDRIDQAMRTALAAVYQEGKDRGGGLLVQLASGEKTLADFEEGIGRK